MSPEHLPADSDLVLRLDPADDVVIARSSLPAGSVVLIGGVEAEVDADIQVGFKLAARDLAEGHVVHRAGVPIGRITHATPVGALVHLRNLESLYLRTHARGEA